MDAFHKRDGFNPHQEIVRLYWGCGIEGEATSRVPVRLDVAVGVEMLIELSGAVRRRGRDLELAG